MVHVDPVVNYGHDDRFVRISEGIPSCVRPECREMPLQVGQRVVRHRGLFESFRFHHRFCESDVIFQGRYLSGVGGEVEGLLEVLVRDLRRTSLPITNPELPIDRNALAVDFFRFGQETDCLVPVFLCLVCGGKPKVGSDDVLLGDLVVIRI